MFPRKAAIVLCALTQALVCVHANYPGGTPGTDFNGTIDGTYVEDGSGIVHWALGGEYRAEEWYAGATYRHTSTDAGRRLYALSPEVAGGRTGLGVLMMSIGARF